MGSRIGTRIVIAAVGSRKQPTNSIRQVGEQQEAHGSCVNSEAPSAAIISVVRVAVSIQPKIDAAATMNSTVAVVSMVSIDTLTSIFQFSVRYQTSPRNSAHTHAAMAPSVAVNTPRRHAADQQHRRHDRQHRLELEHTGRPRAGARGRAPRSSDRVRCPARAASQIAIGNPATIASSSSALPTRVHWNGMSRAPLVLVREVGDGDHHQDRHHHAGQDAGQEQRAHRDVGEQRVDHERQRRRDDRPERRRRGGHSDRELLV